jgi:hypothetical protein
VRAIHCSSVWGFAAAAFLLATSAAAQSGYSDVPDRFRIEAGGFRIGADTELTFNTTGVLRPPVHFEDLNVPDNATRFYIEGFWRPGRRHQLSVSWYRNNREGDPITIQRDIAWGDRVIQAGATVGGKADSSYLSGVYRFAAYKNERFEIGPSLGIGHLSVDAGISGQGTATLPGGGTVTGPFDVSRSLGQITGDLGGYFYAWALPRLLVRADMRYIIVKPGDSEASITDGRASAVYHITPHFGLGLQYTYTKFRYDRDILSTELGGSLRYRGGQVVVSGAF